MERFPLSLLDQSRHKKVAERLQADGIETVKDLINALAAKENSNFNNPHNNPLVTQDYFIRLGMEINSEDLEILIQSAKQCNKEYESNFSLLFEEQFQLIPKKRECIPLVLQAGLFEKELVNTLNQTFALGEVTEIYGLPGTGKTFLCHHLAANLLIDEKLRVHTPEVLYVDSEGGFDISIYNKIIENLLKEHSKLPQKDRMNIMTYSQGIKAKFFEKLHYKRVLDHLDLVEFLQKLPDVLKLKKSIKLVIFDTFTTHLRSVTDQKNISKIINELSTRLLLLASNCNVSIVLTNMLVYVANRKDLFGDIVCPNAHNKIYLDKYKSNLFFTLEKSHLSLEPIMQKPLPMKVGDKGLEFLLSN